VLALDNADLSGFAQAAVAALKEIPAATMLTAGIADSYSRGVTALTGHDGVVTLLQTPNGGCKGGSALFMTKGATFLASHALRNEVFGPASLLVACRDVAEMLAIIESLEGQLTATVQMDPADLALAQQLLPALERKVGRILVNGFPTGVEVSSAMVHGGPFPATSDGRSSSVGTVAIERFLRPVCYQNFPAELLPQAMRDGNLSHGA